MAKEYVKPAIESPSEHPRSMQRCLNQMKALMEDPMFIARQFDAMVARGDIDLAALKKRLDDL